jgi:predicted nucleotidyltransferase
MTGELRVAIGCDDVISQTWPSVGLAGYRGSVAHGTAGDVIDDVDVGGVFIAPVNHYFGLTHLEHIERIGVAEKYDFALFELRKYVRLLLKSNPNVLSLLWLPQNLYIIQAEWGKLLIDNRQMFLSKRLYKTFGGYAYDQLRRMTHPCTDQAYQGKRRRERFERFGYDCKNAAHLIRLLRMGIEALVTGEINVARHDAKQLKEIKRGDWSLGQIEKEAARLQGLLDEAFVKCELPARPDYQAAERLLINILKSQVKEDTKCDTKF